jgi:hypothetical protein
VPWPVFFEATAREMERMADNRTLPWVVAGFVVLAIVAAIIYARTARQIAIFACDDQPLRRLKSHLSLAGPGSE